METMFIPQAYKLFSLHTTVIRKLNSQFPLFVETCKSHSLCSAMFNTTKQEQFSLFQIVTMKLMIVTISKLSCPLSALFIVSSSTDHPMFIFLLNTKPNPPFYVYLFSITSIDLIQLMNLK
jgi:hypothetical protein